MGIFVSSLLLASIGFPRGAKPGAVDPSIAHRLGIVYVPVMVALYSVAIAFLSTYRISRATHHENLRRLSAEPYPGPAPSIG
jgi:hypothetical protein